MPIGPGKYDEICGWARARAKAIGALLIILGGERGNGFSAQFMVEDQSIGGILELAAVPKLLREVADEIERATGDTKRGH